MIEIGSKIWSADRVGADGYPVGGVVTDIYDSVDADTGEVRRCYRTLCHVGAKPPVPALLSEAEIDKATVEPAIERTRLTMIRRICQAIGAGKGDLTHQEQRFLTDIVRLHHTNQPGGKESAYRQQH